MRRVAIVDYGLANIRSVVNAFNCFEAEVTVAEHGDALATADAIVLPGVGSFDVGMRGLRERRHEDALTRFVCENERPFLGVCLGMQFLLEGSEEGSEPGLGWLPGRCRHFPPDAPKVPHMGWNGVELARRGHLFSALVPPLDFYFVHSYYVPAGDAAGDAATALCEHGVTFVAALERDNIHAVQFHPEKSQLAGMKLIETFLAL